MFALSTYPCPLAWPPGITAVGGRFLQRGKATICLFGHKLLQLDTNQTPGLSSEITLNLFKVVAITLPQESTDLSGPGPTITAV